MSDYATREDLLAYQSLPLEAKVSLTENRILDWYRHFGGSVCVAFSGGKDSTVLLHLVRKCFPDVRAVFSDTGLEYPEIRKFAMSFPNVDVVKPNLTFSEVVSTYGYPLIGKEVAEAIYYARRLRSQSVQVERERRRRDLHGQRRSYESGQKSWGADGMETEGTGRGNPHQHERSEEPQNHPTGNVAKSRGSTEWADWRRGCL